MVSLSQNSWNVLFNIIRAQLTAGNWSQLPCPATPHGFWNEQSRRQADSQVQRQETTQCSLLFLS